MSWSKIKNIMIAILVIINLFLLVNIILFQYMSHALPEGVEESFVNILSKRGIGIKENIIPNSYEVRHTIAAKTYELDYLTEIFIGEKVEYFNEGKSVVATKNGKKLTISEDRIEFITDKEKTDKSGGEIIKALEKKGLNTEGAYFDEENKTVRLKLDNFVVEGVYLNVKLDRDNEISYLEGVWPEIAVEEECKESVISAVNGICDAAPKGSYINDIDEIYLYKKTDMGCVIVPGWRIYTEGDLSYIVTN